MSRIMYVCVGILGAREHPNDLFLEMRKIYRILNHQRNVPFVQGTTMTNYELLTGRLVGATAKKEYLSI